MAITRRHDLLEQCAGAQHRMSKDSEIRSGTDLGIEFVRSVISKEESFCSCLTVAINWLLLH